MDDDLQYTLLPDDYTQYDLSFKLIVIGDSGVGKSCLTMKATKNLFENHYSATVGFEFFTFNIKINDRVVKLQIWDTCGQEIYRSLITNFYRNSSLAMMVYSIDNQESFENIDSWLKELKTQSNPDVKVFLIGNKTDLEEKRKVNKEVAETYKSDNTLDYFIETSAKNGYNAKNVFIEAAKMLYRDYLKYKDRVSRQNSIDSTAFHPYNSNIRLPQPSTVDIQSNEKSQKKSCC